jgi:hypothetical protein
MRGDLLNRQPEIVGFLRDNSHTGRLQAWNFEEDNTPLSDESKNFLLHSSRRPGYNRRFLRRYPVGIVRDCSRRCCYWPA